MSMFIHVLSEIYDNLPCDGFFNMNAIRNMGISNNFPPIGTFSLETALGPPTPHQHQPQGPPPPMGQGAPIGFFDANEVTDVMQNPSTIGVFQSNSVLSNGGGTSSSMYGSQSNSSSAANDPSQTTRETGIIEKLLVSQWIYIFDQLPYNIIRQCKS